MNQSSKSKRTEVDIYGIIYLIFIREFSTKKIMNKMGQFVLHLYKSHNNRTCGRMLD